MIFLFFKTYEKLFKVFIKVFRLSLLRLSSSEVTFVLRLMKFFVVKLAYIQVILLNFLQKRSRHFPYMSYLTHIVKKLKKKFRFFIFPDHLYTSFILACFIISLLYVSSLFLHAFL